MKVLIVNQSEVRQLLPMSDVHGRDGGGAQGAGARRGDSAAAPGAVAAGESTARWA